MSINVNDKNLGHATAYAYYKAGGGTMTEAEFTEFMADFGTASQTAVEAAQAALASKNAAQTAATTATNKASEATTAATTATTKAGEASTSASTATSAKDTAVSASQTATTKATEATTAAATAVSAKDDAVSANTSAQSAKTAAQTAQTGAETAAASVQSSAAQIATNTAGISQLKSDLNKAIFKDVASGHPVYIGNASELPMSIEIDTDTNPLITVQNKNLLYHGNLARTINGITFTDNEDGSINAVGTTTSAVYLPIVGNNGTTYASCVPIPRGKYFLSGMGKPINGCKLAISYFSSSTATRQIITDTGRGAILAVDSDEARFALTFNIENNKTVNATIYPQLEYGENFTAYVKPEKQTANYNNALSASTKLMAYDPITFIWNETALNMQVVYALNTNETVTELHNGTFLNDSTVPLNKLIAFQNANLSGVLFDGSGVNDWENVLINPTTGGKSASATYLSTRDINVNDNSTIFVYSSSLSNGSANLYCYEYDNDGKYITGTRRIIEFLPIDDDGNIINNPSLTTTALSYLGNTAQENGYYKNGGGAIITLNQNAKKVAFTGLSQTQSMTLVLKENTSRNVLPTSVIDFSSLESTKRVKQLSDIVYSNYPDYVLPLAEKVALAAKAHCNENTLMLTVYTDTHYTKKGYFIGTRVATHLATLSNSFAIIHNGDLVDLYDEGKATGLSLIQQHNEIISHCKIPYLQAVGNHDDANQYNRRNNITSANEYIKAVDLFVATTQNALKDITLGSKHGWYYIDDDSSKTRIIVLNAMDYPWIVDASGNLVYDSNLQNGIVAIISPTQLEWFANVALNFSAKESPTEWGAVVNMHCCSSTYLPNVRKIANSFVNGVDVTTADLPMQSDSWSIYDYTTANIDGNYSQYGGRKIAFLMGDNHLDMVDTSAGYPAITQLNASCAPVNGTAPTRTRRTVTETAVSIFVFDKEAGNIHEIRFGAGSKSGDTYNPLTDYDDYRVFNW
jgi:hypothetical protein